MTILYMRITMWGEGIGLIDNVNKKARKIQSKVVWLCERTGDSLDGIVVNICLLQHISCPPILSEFGQHASRKESDLIEGGRFWMTSRSNETYYTLIHAYLVLSGSDIQSWTKRVVPKELRRKLILTRFQRKTTTKIASINRLNRRMLEWIAIWIERTSLLLRDW